MTELGEKIILLKEMGYSYSKIKTELGCSKGTIAYYLGEGQREKSRERQRSRRNQIVKYIQEYKQGKLCVDCGENYPYWILEFDHLGDKSFNISGFRQKTISLELIKKEIAKCDVVCSNCHKNRTYTRIIVSGGDVMDVNEFYE